MIFAEASGGGVMSPASIRPTATSKRPTHLHGVVVRALIVLIALVALSAAWSSFRTGSTTTSQAPAPRVDIDQASRPDILDFRTPVSEWILTQAQGDNQR